MYDTVTACHTVDYLQTETAMDQGGYYEMNPLLGDHPSDERLLITKGVVLGAHWLLANVLPESLRMPAMVVELVPCVAAVAHNHSEGIRIDF